MSNVVIQYLSKLVIADANDDVKKLFNRIKKDPDGN